LACLEHPEVPVNVLLDHAPWTTTLADVLPRNLKSVVLTDETLTWRQGVYDYLLEPWEHNLEALVKLLGKYVLNRERCAPQLNSVTLDLTAAYGCRRLLNESFADSQRPVESSHFEDTLCPGIPT
jgi:hypothetical protein